MAFVDGAASLGRGGLGAVFGSKNLKAIAVRGTKGIKVADTFRFRKVCNGLYKRIKKYPLLKDWQKYGLLMSLPVIPKEDYSEKLFKARMACIGCPIGDKDCLQVKEGKFAGLTKITTSAYNISPSKLYGITDYGELLKLLDLLDGYGIDMFEFYGVINYTHSLYENGLLSEFPVDNFDFNFDNICSWIEKIALRQGFGDIMAEGIEGITKKIGRNAQKFAPSTNKGLLTYISPKGPLRGKYFGTMALGQILSIRGPHAAPGGSPTYSRQSTLERFPRLLNKIGVPDETIDRILTNNMKDLNIGMLLKYAQDNFMVMAALGICARAQINRFYYADLYPELFSSATGIDITKDEILRSGERIYNLMKLLNIREGFNERDEIPEKWLKKPLFQEYTGKGDITKSQIERFIDQYYLERGWDAKGLPTDEKLRDLGLKT